MTGEASDLSLGSAVEVLRLIDEQGHDFDIHRDGFRIQCVQDAKTLAGATRDDDPGRVPGRQVLLRARVAGRFHGDPAAFSRGEQIVRVDPNTVIGHIATGSNVTVVTAGVNGNIAHGCVAPDQFVEYGQVLLVIDGA